MSLEFPRVLGAFASSPNPKRSSISTPISSASTPQLQATETLQAVKDLLNGMLLATDAKSQWKCAVLKTLLELVDVAEQKSVMHAMQLLLEAMYPSNLYDKYSTPDKPSKSEITS